MPDIWHTSIRVRQRAVIPIVVLAACFTFCARLVAQGPASRAANTVRRSLEFYQGLEGFSMDCDLDFHIEKGNFSGGVIDSYSVAMQRPNRLALGIRGGSNDVAIVCDGSSVFTYIAALDSYQTAPAPASVADIQGEAIHKFTEHLDPLDFLELFLDRSPSNILSRAGASAESAGAENVDGVPCSHIRFPGPEWTSQIWVEEGARPIIHKFEYDISVAKVKSFKTDSEMSNATMRVVLLYRNWKLNPAFAAGAFKFKPPPGAVATTSLHNYALEKESAPLLGKPAPAFTLDLLDGSHLDLAEHRGKHTVILEFWAVWSVPSTRALQELTPLADGYKNRDVVFYAIDAGDAPELVNAALARLKVGPAVGIERTNEISILYDVSAPRYVIIDKQGLVRFCSDDYRYPFDLKHRLDEVLAGEPRTLTRTAYRSR